MPLFPAPLHSSTSLDTLQASAPFSASPSLPFCRVRADKSYLLLHCLTQPWIHWRPNLLQKWSESLPKGHSEIVLWIGPPRVPEEHFFIQSYPSLLSAGEKSVQLATFLGISWMHYLRRAFLSAEDILSVRLEHALPPKRLRLIRNHLYLNVPSLLEKELKISVTTALNAAATLSSAPRKEPTLFFAENDNTLELILKILKSRSKENRPYLIFLALPQKSNTTLLHHWSKHLNPIQFEELFQKFAHWFVLQHPTTIALECASPTHRYYFDAQNGQLWCQFSAEWICHGQMSLNIVQKSFGAPSPKRLNRGDAGALLG